MKLRPSKKLCATLFGVLVAGLAHQFQTNQETILTIGGMVGAYVFGQSYVDGKLVDKGMKTQ